MPARAIAAPPGGKRPLIWHSQQQSRVSFFALRLSSGLDRHFTRLVCGPDAVERTSPAGWRRRSVAAGSENSAGPRCLVRSDADIDHHLRLNAGAFPCSAPGTPWPRRVRLAISLIDLPACWLGRPPGRNRGFAHSPICERQRAPSWPRGFFLPTGPQIRANTGGHDHHEIPERP